MSVKHCFSRLSVIVSMAILPSCAGDDIDKGLRLGARIYNFDYQQKAGLIVADYLEHAVRILPDPIMRPNERIEIKQVTVEGKPLPLNFAHTAVWLDENSFVLTLSKLNAGNPKLQGMILIVDAAARTAVRIDDIFADRKFQTFPTYARPCSRGIAVSYAHLNALIVFEPTGQAVDLVGEKSSILPRLRPQVAASLRNIIDVPISNPHGIACTDNAMFLADTGHGRILRIQGNRVSMLHRTGEIFFTWRAEAPASPTFTSPVVVRTIDSALYFNDESTGELFKVDPSASIGVPIEGTNRQFRTALGEAPIKFFDFIRIDGGWLINLGTGGVIRRMRDS